MLADPGGRKGGEFAAVRLGDGTRVETRVKRDGLPAEGLQLGLRPEMVKVGGAVAAEVELVERLGERTLVYAVLGDGAKIIAEDVGSSAVRVGDKVGLAIRGEAAHLFGAHGRGFHAAWN